MPNTYAWPTLACRPKQKMHRRHSTYVHVIPVCTQQFSGAPSIPTKSTNGDEDGGVGDGGVVMMVMVIMITSILVNRARFRVEFVKRTRFLLGMVCCYVEVVEMRRFLVLPATNA